MLAWHNPDERVMSCQHAGPEDAVIDHTCLPRVPSAVASWPLSSAVQACAQDCSESQLRLLPSLLPSFSHFYLYSRLISVHTQKCRELRPRRPSLRAKGLINHDEEKNTYLLFGGRRRQGAEHRVWILVRRFGSTSQGPHGQSGWYNVQNRQAEHSGQMSICYERRLRCSIGSKA